jgi:ribose transport system ATP-binding protein
MDDASRTSVAAAGGPNGPPAVVLRHLSKTFGGERALDDVSLTIRPGEVHGLLGENGSGKSTLIKVLSGFHAPDPGAELEIGGQSVRLPLAPGEFRSRGLSFVHQDLGLIPEISIVENLRVGEVVARRGGFISWKTERRHAREAFARYGLDIDPSLRVDTLSETGRALLAIVRAVEGIRSAQQEHGHRGGLLVLDEPTVFLPQEGTDQLFAIIRDIVASGDASVLFVSHDLDEVRRITDCVTVLRDGRLQGTVVTAEASEVELVEMIIGRSLAGLAAREASATRSVALALEGVTGGLVDDVSLRLHDGETLGLTGLRGSGFEDLPYLVFGAKPCSAGTLTLGDERIDLTSLTPAEAVGRGLALLPGDRQRDGSEGSLPVGENVSLPVLDDFRGPLGLRRRQLDARTRTLLHEFDVRPPDPTPAFSSLSGGNQQKAMLAKWLQTEPHVILLHEPTQGVDVGARERIFGMLGEAARGGASILCASSDYEQLAAICDRVLVIGRGRVVQELRGAEVTKERIAEQVYQSVSWQESTTEIGD